MGSPGITEITTLARAYGGLVTSAQPVAAGLGGEVESEERHERISAGGIELVHLSVGRIRRSVAEAAGHLLHRAQARAPVARAEPPGLVVVPRGPLLR